MLCWRGKYVARIGRRSIVGVDFLSKTHASLFELALQLFNPDRCRRGLVAECRGTPPPPWKKKPGATSPGNARANR